MSSPEIFFLDRAAELGFDGKKIIQAIRREGYEPVIIKYAMEGLNRPRDSHLLAGAIQMFRLYETSFMPFIDYLNIFRKFFRPEIYDYCLKNQAELLKLVRYENDFRFGNFPANTLIRSYLARIGYHREPQEIPQYMKIRISVATCYRHGLKKIRRCFTKFGREFTFATPTIVNAGFQDGNPTSCIIDSVPDSLDGIYSTMHRAAMASKRGAGLGIDVSSIRHSEIGRSSQSSGLGPMLKMYDQSTGYARQNNVRQGSMVASLRVSHIDLPRIVQACDLTAPESEKLNFLHVSIMTSDIFWKRVESRGMWRLFCPKHAVSKSFHDRPSDEKDHDRSPDRLVNLHGKAFEALYLELEKEAEQYDRYKNYQKLRDLLTPSVSQAEELSDLEKEFAGKDPPREIVSAVYPAFELAREITGMMKKRGFPYITSGCSINRKNPNVNVGPVRSLNLCQEIAEPVIPGKQTASCNLMSICLANFVNEGKFNFESFSKTVRFCIFLLNEIIAMGTDDPLIEKSNRTIRPVGLGINGFFDMLALMDLTFLDPSSIPDTDDLERRYRRESADLVSLRLSPQVMALTKKIWSCMYFNALQASNRLVKCYGKYEAFDTSPYAEGKLQYHFWQEEEKELKRKYPFSLTPDDPSTWGQEGTWDGLIRDIKEQGLTNSLHLTIMPTATSAQILDVCESIEQHSQNIYVRRLISGDIFTMNYHMIDDLQKIGLWNRKTYDNIVLHDGSLLYLPETDLPLEKAARLRFLKEKYRTMWELPQRLRMILAAQMQVFIDQSISFNLYFESIDDEILIHVLHYGWKLGMKTLCYYLRSKASVSGLRIGYQGPGKNASLIGAKDGEPKILKDQDPEGSQTEEMRQKIKFDLLIPEPPKCAIDNPECLACQV